jgi:hypothetical protein
MLHRTRHLFGPTSGQDKSECLEWELLRSALAAEAEREKAIGELVEAARRYYGPCEAPTGAHCPMVPIPEAQWCRACRLSAALTAFEARR